MILKILARRMPRSRKINLEKVRASLDKTCPNCGFTITPDLVKRVDFERVECPKCGEKFQPAERERN
jgi:ribosomal protein S27AE